MAEPTLRDQGSAARRVPPALRAERQVPSAKCQVKATEPQLDTWHSALGTPAVGRSALGTRHAERSEAVSPLRQPVVASPKTIGQVTEEIAGHVDRRASPSWWGMFALATGAFLVGLAAMIQAMVVGMGVWGINRTVGWGFDIANFVFWIGIGHAGTMISAVLFLFRQRWRTAINRVAEGMTVFAVTCAGIYPLVHMGRPWYFYWLAPYPNNRGSLWVNFRSPLLWDFFAIGTYFVVSLVFWYVGMIPDLATLRDRVKTKWNRALFGALSLGWDGSARAWHRYEATYALLALLATPLVIAVCAIVSFDFATSVIPGWHTTIFPPYFLTGAIFCGFAVVTLLLLATRKAMRLETFITEQHLNWLCKVLLLGSFVVGLIYAIEFFTAWYSANPYELSTFVDRATGAYAGIFWTMVLCNVAAPQVLWSRRARRTPWIIGVVAALVVIGMWCERFIIVVTSLHRDYLPSSWAFYLPSANEVAILAGMFGLFFSSYLLFIRLLPVIPIAEIKGVLDYARRPANAQGGHFDLTTESTENPEQARRDGSVGRSPLRAFSVPYSEEPPQPPDRAPASAAGCPPERSEGRVRWRGSQRRRRRTPPVIGGLGGLVPERFTIGYFESEEGLIGAVRAARRRGVAIAEAFTPYPVHGLAKELGLPPSRLPWVAFGAGALGLALILAFQVWTSAYDWPLRVGGQPMNAWIVWAPVAIMVTVLAAAIAGVGALLVRARLWPGKAARGLPGVTDNRFALVLQETDAAIDEAEVARLLRENGATRVEEGDEP